jgi:DEAD/DEAH box helicase domain-containing protein
MLKKIVLDLETQKSFEEVGGRGKNHLLKVSVCGIYDYSQDKYLIYEEHELPKLAPILESADQIIGFNIVDFDFAVIQPYLNFDILKVPTLDLLVEVNNALGHRLSLETVAQGTLGTGKSGSGKEALVYFKNGRLDLLKKYCLDDVKITRLVYEYGLKNRKLLYRDFFTVKEIPVGFSEPQPRVGIQQQTVLF